MTDSKDLSEGAGSPSAVSKNLTAASQKMTAASTRGPKKPAGQVRKQAVLTRFPIPSSTRNSTVTSSKPSPSIKGRPSTPNKTKRLTSNRNSSLRPGQGDRVFGGRADTTTAPAILGHVGASTAPQKPIHLRSDAEKWKKEYEELLEETKKSQAEQDQAKRDLDKALVELTQQLTATEKGREQIEFDAAALAEEGIAARMDLELCRHENGDLKLEKKRLLAQLDYASGVIEDLQAQTNLAGELQTELNSLRNVRLPSLERDNNILKQELHRVLLDVETPSSSPNCAPSPFQAFQGNSEGFLGFLKANEIYVKQLEETCGWLEKVYADTAFEVEGLENHIAALQSTTGHLKNQYTGIAFRDSPFTDELEEVHEEKRILRVMNASTSLESTATIASITSTALSLAGIVAAVQTQPSSPSDKPKITSSENFPVTKAKSRLMLESSTTFASALATQSISSAPSPKPRAPLDRDLQITINIEPSAQAKLSLLERLTAITTKGTSFKINGPAEIAKALSRGMEDAQARAKHNETQVLELQQMIWYHISEVERKKIACNLTEHKTLADQLAAMEARLQMQDILLADNGRQLAQLRKERTDG
ncbi:uncharacterized protein CC84DRAFT_1172470 [Paraphaeosphaeria sporulosa]|uniref:Uncharacterized protein n=1 Tax=Paraphaeosphaeria sporulosa TaxID=1460663 RepID=A0A177CSW9_9PLEO|nr:uncharacterized protein CC84DRAFT_1172470 [Paraphaeosphaeria sporulosa]OAG09990.1 hypothetical protein CC84DRAFT_1172470 [Paraphaeosphaeria sporulosa]